NTMIDDQRQLAGGIRVPTTRPEEASMVDPYTGLTRTDPEDIRGAEAAGRAFVSDSTAAAAEKSSAVDRLMELIGMRDSVATDRLGLPLHQSGGGAAAGAPA